MELARANALFENDPAVSVSLEERERRAEMSVSLGRSQARAAVRRILGPATGSVSSLTDPGMVRAAGWVLDELADALVALGVTDAPALRASRPADGSLLMEWTFADRRLGFNIEPVRGESGWYYVFSRESGGESGSGLLSSLDAQALLTKVIVPRR